MPRPTLSLAALALLAGLVGAAPPAPAPAQGADKASARLYTRSAADGIVRAAIEIEIAPHWHLYHTELGPPDAVGRPTSVRLAGAGIRWSEVRFPEPKRLAQPGLGEEGGDTWILAHEGTIVLHAAGRIEPAAEPGAITAELSGLACEDGGACILYREELRSAGAGPDRLFASFPAELAPDAPRAPPARAAEPPARASGPAGGAAALAPAFGRGAGLQKAHARLFARAADGRVRAALEIRIDEGWHLYHDELGPPDAVGKPTRARLEGGGIRWSALRFPAPERLEQPGLGEDGRDTWIQGHEGTIVLWALGEPAGEAGAEPALDELSATIDGLTCEDSGSCVPYRETVERAGAGPDALFAAFPGDLELPAPGAPSEPAPGATAAGGSRGVDYAAVEFPDFAPRGAEVQRSLWLWLALALVAGAILNVMPCVLPVISIKVLSFVQQAGEDRRRVLHLGLAFAAGIVVVFVALALAAILLEQSWGEQFQSSTFLVVMIGVVFAFALSLFGVYELGVPQQVGALAATRREGLPDAFFKGMLATVLATPCSGPFLGSTLTWTLSQSATTILAIFLALGVGMAFPYVVLTANPRLLRVLPKPGAWMETFKQAMGFVLLATVVYLMISLNQELILFTVAFLVFVALGCWWWGRFATFDKSHPRRLAHLAVAFANVGSGAYASFGALRDAFADEPGEGGVPWERFEPAAFLRHLEEGRNVFVDFTADWCPNCKWNELFVYESDEVVAALRAKNVVPMKADITHDSAYTEMCRELLAGLGARSIPTMAIFPGDEPLEPRVRLDVVTRSDVLQLLRDLPETPKRTALLGPFPGGDAE
jgi:cytochrome c biogenesis protein CcdA/DsbC/DsbD-like thiol-disulfide interchange protein/thiol-disulfide isomerase/thioredoxin